MDDDYKVDIEEQLIRSWVLKDITININTPHKYDQLVVWLSWQYDLII